MKIMSFLIFENKRLRPSLMDGVLIRKNIVESRIIYFLIFNEKMCEGKCTT